MQHLIESIPLQCVQVSCYMCHAQARIISTKEVNPLCMKLLYNKISLNGFLVVTTITKVKWVIHGGARCDPVQSSNEKVKVSTCEKLILFCIYNMLCQTYISQPIDCELFKRCLHLPLLICPQLLTCCSDLAT